MSDTLASILKQAEAHGILQRKVVKGKVTEYLPTHPGEASTANKALFSAAELAKAGNAEMEKQVANAWLKALEEQGYTDDPLTEYRHTIHAIADDGKTYLFRVDDGWGEWYVVWKSGKANWIAQKMPDVSAYQVSKELSHALTKPKIEVLGWGDKAWDRFLADWLKLEIPDAKWFSQVCQAEKQHTGAMLALYPDTPPEFSLMDQDLEPTASDELHVTMAYLGDAAGLDEEDRGFLRRVCEQIASEFNPIQAKLGGIGRFLNLEDDDTQAYYASVDSPGIEALRARLVEVLGALGLLPDSDHGFTPHMTLAYVPVGKPAAGAGLQEEPVEFGGLSLSLGGEREDFPFKVSGAKQNIMLTYPDESKIQRFVWQQHFRGKSSHGDFRVQSGDYLVGWTIPDQNPGAITEPVETLAQATAAVNNPDLWKMNLATGEIKPREIRSGVVRKGDLRALPKGVEIPEDWLNEQGVTDKPDPGEAIPVGATRNFPGVFKIVDKGTVEHGAKKPWLAEYWIHGDKWGTQRWLFRLLERGKSDGLQAEGWEEEAEEVKQDTLPPGVIEQNARDAVFWIFMQPDDQTPYVLGKEAVDKDWLPPKGVSALPKAIRERVPKELRYWEVSGKEALDRRAKLAEMDVRELGGSSAKQLDWKPYYLQRHWFRGPIQVRFGASDQHYDLRIVLNGKHWHLVIDGNPLTNDRLPAYEETKYSGNVATADGKRVSVLRIGSDPVELAPGQPANPTKDTPAFIQTVDEGEARLIDDQPEFKKVEFKGGKLKGAWYFRLESPDSKIGEFGKSEGPAVKGEKGVRPLFGSPGGKRLLAKTIVDLIPPHKVYVEPFAGGAAVLFAKPPEMSEKEVLADADPDIAFAYRTVKGLSDAEIEKLNGMEWRIGKFDEVKDSSPDGKLGKLHKWLYLRKSSQGALGDTQNQGQSESRAVQARNLPDLRDRLAPVTVRSAKYPESLKEWDDKETFFYLDPPYPDTNRGAEKADLRWTEEDCAAFAKALKSLKGKWLVSLQDNQTNRDLFKGYSIRTVTVPTVFNTGGGKGNDRRELLIANYPLPKRVRRKSMDEVEALQLVYTCMGCKGEFESEVVLEEPVCPDCAANWSEAEKFRASQPRDDAGRFASTGLESAEGFSGSLPKDLSKASPKQKRAVVKYLANKPLKELRKRQELVRKQTKLAYDQRNDLALSNLQEMDRHLSAAVDLQQFNKSIDAKALPWQPYLLQRHNDHHDLRIGDDFTLRLSGTLLDNEPDKVEVSTESHTLQGADGQAVDALKVKPGDPVKLSDGEIQTLDKGQARYAKTQSGHQVEFKGGKLEGVYLFGPEGAHPVDLEHIDVEWEPGQPEPSEPDESNPDFPLIPIHPPQVNPDLIHPFNPNPPVIPGVLPPPGIWNLGSGEVAMGWKVAQPSTAEGDVVQSGQEGAKVGKRIKTEKLSKLQELRQSLESAVKWLGEVIGWASYEDAPEPSMLDFFKGSDAGFTVKTVQGEPWLFTWSANAFKDREGEIFSTKALETWADRASEREDKGTYNFWHIPGSDFAVKRWVGVPGRFLVEAGPFTKDAKGLAAQKFFTAYPDRHPTLAPEGWGCSVEYRYLPEERKKGVYQNVEITRTSVLPRFAAANTWTAVKEVTMALTDAQKKAAQELFGEDLAASILGEAEAKTKELEPNVAHKGEGEQTEPEATPEVQPEAAVAEEAQPVAEEVKAKDEEAIPEEDKAKKRDKKQVDKFVKALADIAGQTDDEGVKKALQTTADKLTDANAADEGKTLKMLAGRVKDKTLKTRLQAIASALVDGTDYPAPSDGEAYPAPTKSKEFIEAVAAELAPQFQVDMAPIGEAMTKVAASLKSIEDRVAALEQSSGRKAATDLPRFVFGLVEQASKADATIVPEGDKLLEQKPKETSRADVDGSIAAHFFPKGK